MKKLVLTIILLISSAQAYTGVSARTGFFMTGISVENSISDATSWTLSGGCS